MTIGNGIKSTGYKILVCSFEELAEVEWFMAWLIGSVIVGYMLANFAQT